MTIIQPRKELRSFVRYYWTLKSDESFKVLTFPIGCPQIIFHRGNPLFIPELGTSQSWVTISGQVNFPAHIQSDGETEMIVVVFYPHTIGMFIDTPPSAFYNLEISGYDIRNREFNEMSSRIFESQSDEKCVNIIEDWLASRIKPSLNIKRIGVSVKTLFKSPATPIKDLADAVCLSKRQFERVFNETIGMNPKEYSRVVRFQKSLWFMQHGEDNYAGIAADCGYADQSHFIKEFKEMSGHTPGAICNYCTPYSDLFTCPF